MHSLIFEKEINQNPKNFVIYNSKSTVFREKQKYKMCRTRTWFFKRKIFWNADNFQKFDFKIWRIVTVLFQSMTRLEKIDSKSDLLYNFHFKI